MRVLWTLKIQITVYMLFLFVYLVCRRIAEHCSLRTISISFLNKSVVWLVLSKTLIKIFRQSAHTFFLFLLLFGPEIWMSQHIFVSFGICLVCQQLFISANGFYAQQEMKWIRYGFYGFFDFMEVVRNIQELISAQEVFSLRLFCLDCYFIIKQNFFNYENVYLFQNDFTHKMRHQIVQ